MAVQNNERLGKPTTSACFENAFSYLKKEFGPVKTQTKNRNRLAITKGFSPFEQLHALCIICYDIFQNL